MTGFSSGRWVRIKETWLLWICLLPRCAVITARTHFPHKRKDFFPCPPDLASMADVILFPATAWMSSHTGGHPEVLAKLTAAVQRGPVEPPWPRAHQPFAPGSGPGDHLDSTVRFLFWVHSRFVHSCRFLLLCCGPQASSLPWRGIPPSICPIRAQGAEPPVRPRVVVGQKLYVSLRWWFTDQSPWKILSWCSPVLTGLIYVKHFKQS